MIYETPIDVSAHWVLVLKARCFIPYARRLGFCLIVEFKTWLDDAEVSEDGLAIKRTKTVVEAACLPTSRAKACQKLADFIDADLLFHPDALHLILSHSSALLDSVPFIFSASGYDMIDQPWFFQHLMTSRTIRMIRRLDSARIELGSIYDLTLESLDDEMRR